VKLIVVQLKYLQRYCQPIQTKKDKANNKAPRVFQNRKTTIILNFDEIKAVIFYRKNWYAIFHSIPICIIIS